MLQPISHFEAELEEEEDDDNDDANDTITPNDFCMVRDIFFKK